MQMNDYANERRSSLEGLSLLENTNLIIGLGYPLLCFIYLSRILKLLAHGFYKVAVLDFVVILLQGAICYIIQHYASHDTAITREVFFIILLFQVPIVFYYISFTPDVSDLTWNHVKKQKRELAEAALIVDGPTDN